MDCVDCDQTSRRRLSPCLTRILNNVNRLRLAVCHALLSSDRLARHEAKSPSAPRRLRPSRVHPSALVGGCEVHAARVAARDLQLQLRLEVHPPGRSRGRGPSFDDSQWESVSTPHTFNDVDSFRVIIDHSGGDRGTYKGISWYRKHFKLPAAAAGSRVFIEFEGMRQAGDIYLNGLPFGLYENGVTAYGLDITSGLHFGDQDNVIAVRIDNKISYQERATGIAFRWNANDFNPDFGGINRRVWLHVTGNIYQTLPLYYGLGTTGTYIYCTDYNIAGHSCTVNIESQVHNATANRRFPAANVTLSAVVVDKDGVVRASYTGKGVDMLAGAKTVLTASGPLTSARFWSPDDPISTTSTPC